LGVWAQLLGVTVEGEGRGRYTTLNTWDRAAFTFGFLQFGAHVPDGDFVQWLRAVLARPEAADYFPTLHVAGGRISDASGPLESAASSSRLMAFLNPNGDRVDAAEILNAARLMDWTRRHPETQALQVEVAVKAFRELLKQATRKVPIDGESDAVCAVVADIRHQGRGGAGVWASIAEALAAPDKLKALLDIGADAYPERCRTVGAAIRAKLAAGLLGTSVYRAAMGEFEVRAAVPPDFAAAAAATATAGTAWANGGTWVPFETAPFAASTPPGNKVLVAIPPDFKPAQTFVVTLFLCGHDLDPPCSQLDQISMIPSQVGASRTNSLLLAPRFGPTSQSGTFDQPGALRLFIEEASRVVANLLADGGTTAEDAKSARDHLATQAPIVIVSFSGGCHTLRYLLANEAELADRMCGVLLLDSIYGSGSGPQPEQVISDWLKRAVDRSWLISLHSTTDRHNNFVMDSLTAASIPFRHDGDWSRSIGELTPGTIAFSRAQGHCHIPMDGPPSLPVQAMLDRLPDRWAKPPVPLRANA
jgi:hypothetical protein